MNCTISAKPTMESGQNGLDKKVMGLQIKGAQNRWSSYTCIAM